MSPRPRLLCALAAVLVSLVSLLAFTEAPAAAQEPDLRVQIDSLTPYATATTKQVRITGRVVNTGDEPLSTVNAMFWVDESPLTTRRDLSAAAAERPGERLGRRLDEPWQLVDEVTETLRPRASARFQVVVPVEELHLSAAGIYVVGVDIRATPPHTSERETWRTRSFLPYVAKDTAMTPVEVSFLLPVTGSPGLVSGDQLTGTSSATAPGGTPNIREFGPDGRLTRLLQLGSAHDLSFVVDPELLAEAEVMANGYSTATGQQVTPAEVADVRRWLNRARGILGAGHTLMLPYADPDLTALESHRITDRFGSAVAAANRAVKTYKASGTLAWPGRGYADAGTLETIAGSGQKTVLLSKQALSPLPADGSSPVASLSTPEGALTALVMDPTLTAGGPGGQESAVYVQQRFLSETALLAMQKGASSPPQRRVVAAFPRNWNPGAAGANLFSTVDSTSWLRPVSAGALLSQAPTAYGGPLGRSAFDERAALGPDVVSHLRQLSATTDTLLDLLAEPKEARGALDLGFLRGTSMAWRHHPDQAIDLIDQMDADLRSRIADVEVVPPRLVTLSSQTGRFPVTISNQGDRAVHVQLEVQPRDPDLLKIAPIETVRVDPHRKATVSVTAEATGGRAVQMAQMEVRLSTPAGTEFGATESFPVRITGYGQVGWIVIVVGLSLLMLAAGTRIIRRVRAAVGRRPDQGDAYEGAADEAASPSTPPAEEEPAGTSSQNGAASADVTHPAHAESTETPSDTPPGTPSDTPPGTPAGTPGSTPADTPPGTQTPGSGHDMTKAQR